MIRVLVVSDIRLYREGLADMLRRDRRIEVLGTAGQANQIEPLVASLGIDVVLLDMSVPQAMAVVRRLAETHTAPKVVALGVSERRREVVACAEAGVSGYVFRESSIADLVAAVEGAVRDELCCSPRIAAALLQRVAKLSAQLGPEVEFHLTPRETEVAQLLDDGLTNQEIAGRLNIAISTVKVHVHNILDKIGAQHRGEAAARLRRLGLLRMPRLSAERA